MKIRYDKIFTFETNLPFFQPSKSFDSDPHHEGYWWLAFEPKNYRLSCTFCNSLRDDRESGASGGKGDYFPVFDEANRVKPEGVDFRREDPLLLDPCNRRDVSLLWFEEDGRAISFFDKNDKPWAFKRADESIKYYNLNEIEIKEARQALYSKIMELIEAGEFYFEEAFNCNPLADNAFEKVLKELAQLTHKDSEFSAFAKAIIISKRSKEKRPWLDKIDVMND